MSGEGTSPEEQEEQEQGTDDAIPGENNRELQPLAAAAKPSRKRKRSRAVSPERGGPRSDGCMRTCGFPGTRQSGAISSEGNGSRVPAARPGCDMEPGLCMEYKETALYQVSGCYQGKYCEACLRVLSDEASRLGQAIETVELKPRHEKEPPVNPEPRPPEEGEVLKERWERPQERSDLTTTRRELWPLTPRELTETYGNGYHILVKMELTETYAGVLSHHGTRIRCSSRQSVFAVPGR